MNKSIFHILHYTRRACSLAGRALRRVDESCARRLAAYQDHFEAQQRKNMIRVAESHNMVTQPDEAYYLQQYWCWISRALARCFSAPDAPENGFRALDLGCGQARLTVPLAAWISEHGGGAVTGVDITPAALAFARDYAGSQGVGDAADFVESDLLDYLAGVESETCHIVICTEILYMYPDYRKVLAETARILKKGGLFIASFRPRYFYVLDSIASRKWGALPGLLAGTEGQPWGPPATFAWHGIKDIEAILTPMGFRIEAQRGIGVCSGLPGDPNAHIARPSMLSPEEQEQLMAAELALADTLQDAGRYILVEAVKI